MPSCPSCKSRADSPEKIYNVVAEPALGEKGGTSVDLGLYSCTRCGRDYTHVISRRRYVLVPEKEVKGLKEEIESLKKTRELLANTIAETRMAIDKELGDLMKSVEKAELDGLKASIAQVEAHVKYLKKERDELLLETRQRHG